MAKLVFLDYAIQKEKPDIIHLHGCLYASFRNYIWYRHIPVVLRLHGINGYDPAIKGYMMYRQIEEKITKHSFDFVTFVTNNICEEWKEYYGSFSCPMIPIINGYNAAVFHPSNSCYEKMYDLVTFSGLSERKGQDRVLKAIKLLQDEGKKVSYLIIGSGDTRYESEIKKYATDNNLSVKFVEYCPQNEICSYLEQSKYFILPSSSEGFGKVFVESLAAGIPVIVPKHLPIAKEKNILNENNSILIEDESTDSIYKAIKELPNSYPTPSLISSSVEHLSWTNLAKKYVTLYYNVYKKD